MEIQGPGKASSPTSREKREQWTALRWTPTVTAFHPDNDNHELHIPEGAEPFDSGMLATMQTFRWT